MIMLSGAVCNSAAQITGVCVCACRDLISGVVSNACSQGTSFCK